MSACPSVFPCVQKLTSIPPGVSQNVTNKSCLVFAKNRKYAFWVTLRPLGSKKRGEAKLRILKIPHCFVTSPV